MSEGLDVKHESPCVCCYYRCRCGFSIRHPRHLKQWIHHVKECKEYAKVASSGGD